MKKFLKLTAIIIAAILTVSLVACDAAPDGMEGGWGDILDNPSGGIMQDQNNSSIADGDDAVSPEAGKPDENIPDWEEVMTGVEFEEGEVEGGTMAEAPDAGEPEGTDPDGAEQDTETVFPDDPIDHLPSPSLITTPFINAEEIRFSTFSADVDTASYTYFRKLAGYGYSLNELRNSGSNFRIEEFINYFRYDAKQPGEDELFGVTATIVPCPWNEGTLLLRATLQAENPKNEAPNNLVFLIDVSGSMSSSDKLPLLKKAFSYLVNNLKPSDTISIVTYSGQEAVVLDGCKGSNPDAIMKAINSLGASGSTNGEAGLTMAYKIAEKHMKEGSNNRIIMATDGDLNVGISSADELTKYIEQKRDQGVYLSILGFGTGNYRDDRMEALADNGNGVYYYIDGESEAEKVFGTDLLGTLYTVANDVKLQIEFDPQYVESYRLIGYDNRVLDKEDFENDAKDAGEVGAGHQVTVCYEIKIKSDPTENGSGKYMTLRVRYKNPGEPVSRLNEYEIGTQNLTAQADTDTRFITSVIELASLLRNPDYSGDITVQSVLAELNGLNLTDSYKVEFREIVKALAAK